MGRWLIPIGLAIGGFILYQQVNALVNLKVTVASATPNSIKLRIGNLTKGSVSVSGFEGDIYLNGKKLSDFFQAYSQPLQISAMKETIVEIQPRSNPVAVTTEILKLITTNAQAKLTIDGRVVLFGRTFPFQVSFVPTLI